MGTTILVRTKLTADEWVEIRALALRLGTPVSELVAATLRKHLLNKEA